MKIINKKDSVVNNSNYKSSPKLLQTLQNTLNSNNEGGTISYVFLTERYIFNKEFPNGKKHFSKFIRHSPINREILYKSEKEKLIKRTLPEILQIFENTKDDIGAKYYIIN